MKRGRKVVIVAHCLLNVNAKVEGLAKYSGAVAGLIKGYIDDGFGIIQLPCPETTYIGLKRWGMSRDQYDCAGYRRHCGELVRPYVDQIFEYRRNGCAVETIVGVDGSPSCGVNLVSVGYNGGMVGTAADQAANLRQVSGRGVMMEELEALLKARDIKIGFDAIIEKAEVE